MTLKRSCHKARACHLCLLRYSSTSTSRVMSSAFFYFVSMKTNLKSKYIAILILINLLSLIISLIYTIFQPYISLLLFVIINTLIVLFIINVLLWAWLDEKESETRLKALSKDCDLLETRFKKIIDRRKFSNDILRRYMDIYSSALDKIPNYTD